MPIIRVILLLGASLVPSMGRAAEVTIVLEKREYKVGEEVRATVIGPRQVTVGSDLTQSSTTAETSKPVPLGVVKKPGVYTFTASAPGQSPGVALLVVPNGKAPPLVGSGTFGVSPPAFGERLRKGLTRENLKEAGRRALPKWAASNAANSGKIVAVCGLCASPLAETACPVCGVAVADLGADFLQTYADELAGVLAEKGALTKKEADLLRASLKVGKAILALADVTKAVKNPEGRLEAALGGAKVLTDEIPHAGLRLGITYLLDETGKVVVLLKITK